MSSSNAQTGSVPRIETERLILRAHEAKDFQAASAMWTDPRVTRFTIGAASPAQKTWQRILAYRGLWALLGFGYWAVEEKASGRFIGELGFANFKRGFGPEFDAFPELGWALVPAFHGKGYATEALRAAILWGTSHLKFEKFVCVIQNENVESLKLATKLGFESYLSNSPENGTQTLLQLAAARK